MSTAKTFGQYAGSVPKKEASRYALDFTQKHTHLTLHQILPYVKARYPEYKESDLRALLHHYGVSVFKRAYTKTGKGPTGGYEGKPTADSKQPPKLVHRAAVHSYSGRSRLSAGYQEL